MSRSVLSDTTTVVLAGGLGTRLRETVRDRPKVLADVGGQPFLAILLEQLEQAGLRHAVVCTGYQAEQIETTFGPHYRNLELSYSREESPLGTAGALRLALPLIRSSFALILNGDSYCSVDLNAFWEWSVARKGRASIVVVAVDDASRFGRVIVAADGFITRFEEKRTDPGPAWINAGIYRIGREHLESVPEGRPVSLESELFPVWVESGLCGYRTTAPFFDIGTAESYARARDFFSKG